MLFLEILIILYIRSFSYVGKFNALYLKNTLRLTEFSCTHDSINLLENEAIVCRIIVAKADDTFYYIIQENQIL